MSSWTAKRFWKEVAGGRRSGRVYGFIWTVARSRPRPGRTLVVPTVAMAAAIAAEWGCAAKVSLIRAACL